MKDFVLFGLQGSGKGTQSQFLQDRYNLRVFETGAELRRLATEDSALGRKVKEIIEAGHLVSTEVVMEIVENFVENLPAGEAALFDGIPRSEDQRLAFDALMQKLGRDFTGILIEISEEEALKRLSTRRICLSCKTAYPVHYEEKTCQACGGELGVRKDDTPEAIAIRIQTFMEKTMPVIEYYQAQNKMLRIHGEQSIEAVTQELIQKLS